MSSRIKSIIIFSVYTFLVFLFCILFFLFFSDSESVLPPDAFAYKFDNGFVFFLKLIPAVLITAEIFGFAWFFGVSSNKTKYRFSIKMLGLFRTVLITCVSFVILCFIAKEALVPIVQNAIDLVESRARNYKEYKELAEEYSEEGSLNSARFYAEEALKLYPDSEEAKALSLRMERESFETDIPKPDRATDRQEKNDFVPIEEEELAYSYLVEAEKAFASSDYINAHYYAEMAAKTTGRDDQNLLRAKEISSVSWTLLNSEKDSFDKESGEVYKTKKEAYNALENGDVLKAYYTLKKLKETCPLDPDVENYFDATVDVLENSYFFVDETSDLRDFETANNVYFAVTKPDGQIDLIFIGGISIIENTGQFIQYFRNFSVTSFTKEGHIKQFFSVPYAKMTAQLVSSLVDSGAVSADWELKTSTDQYIPYIFLEGVDRQSEHTRNDISPKYKYPQDEEYQSFYILDIPFGDLALIRQACSGADTMPFLSLMKFLPKASQYGFSSEVYTASLAKRACYPFVILAIMIYAAIISFHFRFSSGNSFKLRWLLLFPVMTLCAYFCLMIADYMESLLAVSLCTVVGSYCPAVMVAIFIVCVFLVSVRFISTHGE
ncbi:MAG: hypothetical protein K5930_08660 [Treponemataceae bacterium]|nr:hypothetical protein [Treponemataceae bacterium]